MPLRALRAMSAVLTSFALVSCSAVLGFDTLTMGSSSDAGTPDSDAAALADGSGDVGAQDAADAPVDMGTDGPVAIDCTAVHVTTLAGSMLGFADGVGSASLFSTPMGIMVDGAGNILLADSATSGSAKCSPMAPPRPTPWFPRPSCNRRHLRRAPAAIPSGSQTRPMTPSTS